MVSLSDDNLDDASSILPPSGVSARRFKDFNWHLAQMASESIDLAEGCVDEDVKSVSDSVSGNTREASNPHDDFFKESQ